MSTAHSTDIMHGYSTALVGAVVLSLTGIFIRHLSEAHQLPVLVLAFWRNIFVVSALLGTAFTRKWPKLAMPRSELPFLAAYGLLLAVFNGTWTTSVALNGAAVATVLVYCSVGYTALLGRWLLGERMGRLQCWTVVLCLLGCLLVSGALAPDIWNVNAAGIVTGMLSGLCYGGYCLMGRGAGLRGMNAWTTLTYIFGFAALFHFMAILVLGESFPLLSSGTATLFRPDLSLEGWLFLAGLAVGPTLIGFGLYNKSLTLLPAVTANTILTLEPAFTAIIAYLLFDELFTPLQWLGSILIISAVLLLNHSMKKKQRAQLLMQHKEVAHER